MTYPFGGVIKMEKVIKDGKEVIEWDQVSPPDAPGRINIDPVTGDVGVGTPTGDLGLGFDKPSAFAGNTGAAYQRDGNNPAYMFTSIEPHKEVLRITRNGVRVDPDITPDEAAKAVLNALDEQIKTLVQRARADDEALLRQALECLEHEAQVGNDDAYRPLRDAIKERLK